MAFGERRILSATGTTQTLSTALEHLRNYLYVGGQCKKNFCGKRTYRLIAIDKTDALSSQATPLESAHLPGWLRRGWSTVRDGVFSAR